MHLVSERNDQLGFDDYVTAVEFLVSRVSLLIVSDTLGQRIPEAQGLINEARLLLSRFTESIGILNRDPSRENLLATSKLLKLQSRLAVSVGHAVKHVGSHLRLQSSAIRSRRASAQ